MLSGSISRRGDQGCRGHPAYEHPDAVDVDGDRVAIGLFSDECTADNGPWDDSVVVVAGGARTTLPVGRQGFVRDVALAGRYVAWVNDRSELGERTASERRFTGALILRSLDGPARRLAFFPERRRRVEHLDLDATRATWAGQPMRRGYEERPRDPARIVVRAL